MDYESTLAEDKARTLAATSRTVFAATAATATSATAAPAAVRVLERSVDPKIKALELGLESVKAGLAQTNDDVTTLKKNVNEGFEKVMGRLDAIDARLNRLPQLNTYRPQQAAYQAQPFNRGRGRGNRGYPVTPGLTGGPGFVNNTNSQSWKPLNPRPMGEDTTTATAAFMSHDDEDAKEVPGAMASMQSQQPTQPPWGNRPQPQRQSRNVAMRNLPQRQQPLHPMTDMGQNSYPYEDMWAPHMEQGEEMVQYEAPYSGTYSFYEPGFQ